MEHTAVINADLSCRSVPADICTKQGDSGRYVRVRFRSGGKAFDLTDAASTEIRVKKPDGTITITPGVLETGGAVYPLTAQSLNTAGEGRAEFMLYDGNGTLISTVPARLIIAASPAGDEAAASTNDFGQYRTRLTAIEGRLSSLSFLRVTDEQYAELTPRENTLYFVDGTGGNITLYLGSVQLLEVRA